MNVKNVKDKKHLMKIQTVNAISIKRHAHHHQIQHYSIFYKQLQILILQIQPKIKMIHQMQLIPQFKVQLLNALEESYIVINKIKMDVPNAVMVMFGIKRQNLVVKKLPHKQNQDCDL